MLSSNPESLFIPLENYEKLVMQKWHWLPRDLSVKYILKSQEQQIHMNRYELLTLKSEYGDCQKDWLKVK